MRPRRTPPGGACERRKLRSAGECKGHALSNYPQTEILAISPAAARLSTRKGVGAAVVCVTATPVAAPPVVAALITAVPTPTLTTKAPAGMPAPLIGWPGTSVPPATAVRLTELFMDTVTPVAVGGVLVAPATGEPSA